MIKKLFAVLMISITLLTSTSCSSSPEPPAMEPKIDEMKTICELSVMECYYHNVAKYFDEKTEGILWWQKDKRFWIEYGGVVKFGIDASLVSMKINEDQITITIPEAKVLSCRVNENELTKDSYIVDAGSAKVTADDEIKAFEDAQRQLEESAANDTALLLGAQERAKSLLKEYIMNIGEATGRNYTIDWVYLDTDGTPVETKNTTDQTISPSTEPMTEETAQ